MFRRKKKDATPTGSDANKKGLGGMFRMGSGRKSDPEQRPASYEENNRNNHRVLVDSDSDYDDSENVEIFEDHDEGNETSSPEKNVVVNNEEPVETEVDRKARARQAVEERKRKAREAVAARKARAQGKTVPEVDDQAQEKRQQEEQRMAAAKERARVLELAKETKRRQEEEELRREEAEMKALEEELRREEEEAKQEANRQKKASVEVETVESEDIDSEEGEEYYEKATEKLAKEAERLAAAEQERLNAEETAAAAQRARWKAEEEEARMLQEETDRLAREEEEMEKLEAELEERARAEDVAKLEAMLKADEERLKTTDEESRMEEEKRKAEEALLAMQQFIDTPQSPRDSAPDLDALLDESMNESGFLDAMLDGPIEADEPQVVTPKEATKEAPKTKNPPKKTPPTKPSTPTKARYKTLITPSPQPKRKTVTPKPTAPRVAKTAPKKTVSKPTTKPKTPGSKPTVSRIATKVSPKPRTPVSKPIVPRVATKASPKTTVSRVGTKPALKPIAPKRVVKAVPRVVSAPVKTAVFSPPPRVRRTPDKRMPNPTPPPKSATKKASPSISVKEVYAGVDRSPRPIQSPGGRSIDSEGSHCTIQTIPRSPFMPPPADEDVEMCENPYIVKLHSTLAGCRVCVFKLSPEEKEQYEKTGRHLRVALTAGGCYGCQVFPSEPGEDHVRLCKQCFFDTHLIASRREQAFAGTGALAGVQHSKTSYSPGRKRYTSIRR